MGGLCVNCSKVTLFFNRDKPYYLIAYSQLLLTTPSIQPVGWTQVKLGYRKQFKKIRVF